MTEYRMIKISTNGELTDITVDIEPGKLWEYLRDQLHNWIEQVHLGHWAMNAELGWAPVMIVDEEGLIKGLPLNPIASLLYRGGVPPFLEYSRIICGDAYLLAEGYVTVEEDGYTYEEATWKSLPDGFDKEALRLMI